MKKPEPIQLDQAGLMLVPRDSTACQMPNHLGIHQGCGGSMTVHVHGEECNRIVCRECHAAVLISNEELSLPVTTASFAVLRRWSRRFVPRPPKEAHEPEERLLPSNTMADYRTGWELEA